MQVDDKATFWQAELKIAVQIQMSANAL